MRSSLVENLPSLILIALRRILESRQEGLWNFSWLLDVQRSNDKKSEAVERKRGKMRGRLNILARGGVSFNKKS